MTTAQLHIRHTDGREEQLQLNGATVIGRDPKRASIQLEDTAVSSVHATIEPTQQGSWQIRDLESGNGTFLNGTQVQSAVLSSGNRVTVGQTQLTLAVAAPKSVGKMPSGAARLVSARLMRKRNENSQFIALLLSLGLVAFGMGFLYRWLF